MENENSKKKSEKEKIKLLVKSRFELALSEQNIIKADLSTLANVSATAVGKWAKGSLSLEGARFLSKEYGYSIDWLLGGDTTKITGQAANADNDSICLTLLDNQLSAGSGVINLDYPDTVRSIEFSPDKFMEMFGRKTASNFSLAIIDGSSMYNPENLMSLKNGDMVFIDTSVETFSGDGIYAFVLEGVARIKRLQVLTGRRLNIISDNPTYKDEIIEEDLANQIHFIGKLVKKMPMDIIDL